MNGLSNIRRWILLVFVFGLAGTGVELILTEHYETGLQFVPLGVMALGAAVLAWSGIDRSARSIRVLRATMVVFVVSGVVGMGLHYQGGAEFQREIDPAQSNWDIFKKVMRAKAPPVLASGMMVQLGLLGLLYAYSHPTLQQRAKQE
jgi:ribose/xylose/arabinose/galactoside ABC-type transport system permease subunit